MAVDDTALKVGVDLDIKTAIQQVARFEKAMTRAMGGVSKAVTGLGKANRQMADKAVKGAKAAVKGFEQEEGQIDNLSRSMALVEKKMEGASGKQKKVIQEQLRDLKKLQTATKKAFGGSGGKDIIDAKALAKEAGKGLSSAVGEFKSGMTAFLSKDVKGVLEGSLKGATKTLGAALQGAAGGLRGAGGGMKMAGAGLGARGKARGGAVGGGMKMAGGAMKGVGKMMGGLGKVVGMFAKLGPIIGMVGSALFAVVQILIDIEAKGKAFQKDILASASTAGFLAKQAGHADAAYLDLKETVESIREESFGLLDNLDWGISADEHKAVLNTLNQEGVSLLRIGQAAKAAKMEAGELTASLTQVNVAYSRLLGVPLQQITELQATMMTELGMNLDQTKLAFAQMTRDSTESGIAANKFFNIIRGVSQDLSLYNIRMSSAVKMLKLLGKAMNPRNAEKFMQSATQGLKGMSQDDRMKLMILTGGKGKAILDKDIARRKGQLAEDIATAIGGSSENIKKHFNDKKFMRGVFKKMGDKGGALRGAYTEIRGDEKASKKGVYGQGWAAGNVGMGAAYELKKQAIAGGGSMRDKVGELGFHKFAELINMSEEELRGSLKLEDAIEMQREDMLDEASKIGDKDARDAEKARIQRLDAQDLIDEMSTEEQDALKEATKSQMDYAKEQSSLTNSLVDKLGVLVDFVMNQVYNVLMGIWETVVRWFGNDDEARKVEMARSARNVGGAGGKAMERIAGTDDYKKAMAESTVMSALDKAMSESVKMKDEVSDEQEVVRMAEAQKKAAGGDAQQWSPAMEKDLASRKAKIEEKQKKISAVGRTRKKMTEGANYAQLVNAAQMAGGDWDKKKQSGNRGPMVSMAQQFAGVMSQPGGTLEDAQRQTGATDEMVDDLIRKMPWLDAEVGGGAPIMEALAEAGNDLDEAGYEVGEKTQQATEKTADETKKLADAGTKDGTLYVKFSKGGLSDVKKTMEEAILTSVREALFEYYLYSDFDPADLVQKLPTMGGIKGLAEKATSYAAQGRDVGKVLDMERRSGESTGKKKDKKDKPATTGPVNPDGPPAAAGGFLTGPADAPIPATLHGQEFVVPRKGALVKGGGGQGGGGIHITLSPEAGKIIRATAIDATYEAKKRERTGY